MAATSLLGKNTGEYAPYWIYVASSSSHRRHRFFTPATKSVLEKEVQHTQRTTHRQVSFVGFLKIPYFINGQSTAQCFKIDYCINKCMVNDMHMKN